MWVSQKLSWWEVASDPHRSIPHWSREVSRYMQIIRKPRRRKGRDKVETHTWTVVGERELEGSERSRDGAVGKGDDGCGKGKPRGQDLGRRGHGRAWIVRGTERGMALVENVGGAWMLSNRVRIQ